MKEILYVTVSIAYLWFARLIYFLIDPVSGGIDQPLLILSLGVLTFTFSLASVLVIYARYEDWVQHLKKRRFKP